MVIKVKWMAKKIYIGVCVALLLAATPAIADSSSESTPEAVFPQTTHTFDTVMEGTRIQYDFIVENHGSATLEIVKVQPD
jgi:hypothetical protein